MDILTITESVGKDNEGVVVVINGPDGEPYTALDGSPATMTILGSQSTAVGKARDAQTRKFLKNTGGKTDVADLRANRIALASAAVVAWHGWEQDGLPLPLSGPNVALFFNADERILEQVESAIQKHADFLLSVSGT